MSTQDDDFAAMFAAFSIAGFARAKPEDFSGTWSLDIPKSQLDVRMRIEALTMTVAQTDKELKVTTETKRAAPPADAPAGAGGPGGGRGMGRGMGDGTVAYSLDGKESIVEIDGPAQAIAAGNAADHVEVASPITVRSMCITLIRAPRLTT